MPLPALPQTGLQAPVQAEFWLDHAARVFPSPRTRTEQRQRLPTLWKAILEWDLLTEADADPLIAFFDQVQGGNLGFTMFNPLKAVLRSGYAGSGGLVDGASQTGTSLVTDGWPSSTLIFRAGDVFGVATGNQLFRVVADATSDGAGNLTISIAPPIRESPGNNEAILLRTSAVAKMRLDRPVRPRAQTPKLYSFVLEATEDHTA